MHIFVTVAIISGIIVLVGILCFCLGRFFPQTKNSSSNTEQLNTMPVSNAPTTSLSGGNKTYAGNSALSRNVTAEKFQIAYTRFMIQADKNSVTQKANGSRTPYGFESNRDYDGARLSQHFGQGAASLTPYLNWWVVSIYYITSKGLIVIGIEEDRYPHLNQLKPLRFEKMGNKNTRVAVFYSTTKTNINWVELYNTFVEVSEDVMKLGLR